ncbi:MAG: hypothetical protein OEM24_08630 [Paracoccaceae bacterium]|nr:hypothetical protein [Paracoccaceae bacterium]
MPEDDKPKRRFPDGIREGSDIHTLESVFLTIVGLIVLAAFVEAFSYKLVSSRTPFVIMVPLLLLIVFQSYRITRAGALREIRYHAGAALRGRYAVFGKLSRLALAIVGFFVVVYAFGHYIGVAAFVLFLMRRLARERLALSLIVALGTTLALFGIFEGLFGVDLYRGLFFRWLMGYRDF